VIRAQSRVWALAALIAAAPIPAAAAKATEPTVARLVATCDRAQTQGNRGPEAAACEWLAVPCGCKLDRSSRTSEPWCIPPGEAVEEQVRKVVAELRRHPDRGAPAGPAVAETLARLYPCPEASRTLLRP
jgi:hypothetical protein